MGRLAMIVAVVLAALAPGRVLAATDAVFGYWLSENRRAIIEIGPCGSELCGRMVWLSDPVDATGSPKRDVRGAPLCGIDLVAGFRQRDVGRWADGGIYNPRDGKTYSGRLTLIDADRLEVRGFVGLPVFGQSQIWTRAEGDRGGC
ncbi:DUF2147 domain-containing protein [Limibaculum sp. FT325]|uniref:DUF2147 domain-containing protein n=1 Tax=Thermohalobaculum sediminis TaxID=2939436 RepID=UPI0020C15C2A|nr:DUF2147 domain-containing protein [Limibaculum sediminis]MCL5777862.1 DUF2147 domain-containing protein [Limibaculum sediminis]